jgi:hypothetical protein
MINQVTAIKWSHKCRLLDDRESIARGTTDAGTANFTLKSALVLLRFVLGFSTSLVLLALNRFIESIMVLFGGERDSGGGN